MAESNEKVEINEINLRNLNWEEYNNRYWEESYGKDHKMGDVYPESTWTRGKETVTSPLFQVYKLPFWAGVSDEVLNSTFVCKDKDGKPAYSYYTIIDTDWEYAHSLVVKFHLNEYMKENYPGALVSYMGVEHNLAWLEESTVKVPKKKEPVAKTSEELEEEEESDVTIVKGLEFDIQGREHRITIHWAPGIEESFLIQRIPFPVKPAEDTETEDKVEEQVESK